MKGSKWIVRGVVVAALVVCAVLVSDVTIVYDKQPETAVNDAGEVVEVAELTFAEQYALDNWDEKILPAIEERAVDVSTFIADIREDMDAAGEAYGKRANVTSAWSFCVTGRGKVIGVENEQKASSTRLLLDVAPYDGEGDLMVQVSTVIKTNAIRDGVGFLKLDDFTNQVEFAELTKAFNARVQQDVIRPLDIAAVEGEEIEVLGCVSPSGTDAAELLVIPVRLSVVEG